jgi:hypothetical protein
VNKHPFHSVALSIWALNHESVVLPDHGASMVDLGHVFSDFSFFKSDFSPFIIMGFNSVFIISEKWRWPKNHSNTDNNLRKPTAIVSLESRLLSRPDNE